MRISQQKSYSWKELEYQKLGTPLHEAADGKIVEILLSHGAGLTRDYPVQWRLRLGGRRPVELWRQRSKRWSEQGQILGK